MRIKIFCWKAQNQTKLIHLNVQRVSRNLDVYKGDIWPFQTNKKYHMEINQFKDPESIATIFSVKVNDEVKYSKVNTQPMTFPEANLYLSDHDYPSLGDSGQITDFCITNMYHY